MQLALSEVEPWGDERADIRQAVSTGHIVLSQSSETTDEQRAELFDVLQFYLPVNKPQEVILTPAAAAAANE